MSLAHASQRVVSRGICLRSSYLEISRFFRTRRHGITPSCAATCSQHGIRYFSGSKSLKELIEPDERLKKTLEEFKATSMFFSMRLTSILTYRSQTNSLERHRKFFGGRTRVMRLHKHATRCQQEIVFHNAQAPKPDRVYTARLIF
jgi:hypothetical protein